MTLNIFFCLSDEIAATDVCIACTLQIESHLGLCLMVHCSRILVSDWQSAKKKKRNENSKTSAVWAQPPSKWKRACERNRHAHMRTLLFLIELNAETAESIYSNEWAWAQYHCIAKQAKSNREQGRQLHRYTLHWLMFAIDRHCSKIYATATTTRMQIESKTMNVRRWRESAIFFIERDQSFRRIMQCPI